MLIATALAVALLATALLSSRWLLSTRDDPHPRHEFGVVAGHDWDIQLRMVSDADGRGPSIGTWEAARYLTLGAGTISILLLVLALFNPREHLRTALLCTLGLGLLGASLFVMLEPREFGHYYRTVPGHAWTMFLVGSVTGLAAALLRHDWLPPSSLPPKATTTAPSP